MLTNSYKHALEKKQTEFKIHYTAFDGIHNYRELVQTFADKNHLLLENRGSYFIFHTCQSN
jgi:hypothetical protein